LLSIKVFERVIIVLVIVFVLGIAAMNLYSLNAPFEGEGLIDIGEYSLFIKSEGSGTPAVIFESETGESSSFWSQVAEEVQKHTRTVSYDRAGIGKSDKSPYNRTSEQKAIELHSLLNKAKIKPPYILVGSEYGVHHIRMFAAKYPTEVAGIIMVDPRTDKLRELVLSTLHDDEKKKFDILMKQEHEKSAKKMQDGSYEEFLASNQQVVDHQASLKNIPLTAMISGFNSVDHLILEIVEDQVKLAELSEKSKVVKIPSINTYRAFGETELIVQEIIEMINKVK
jgi:hypothetical protein